MRLTKALCLASVFSLVFSMFACEKNDEGSKSDETSASSEQIESVLDEQTAVSDDPLEYLEYWLCSGEVTICGCDSSIVNAVIPAEIDGYPVTTIANLGFYGCNILESVELPDTITTIGSNAFSDCELLSSINIPDSVKSINFAFVGCDMLMEESDGLYYIDDWVVAADSDISEVKFREGTKGIADLVFSENTLLESVEIPDSVICIGADAFHNCSSLTEFIVDRDNTVYTADDGVLYNKQTSTIVCYPPAKEADSYAIPDGVEIIGENAFYRCSNLESVYIPSSVKRIEESAFMGSDSLETVSVDDGLEYIGFYAFADCINLSLINLPPSVDCIEMEAFANAECIYMADNGLVYADTWVIGAHPDITDVILYAGTLGIADQAFIKCTELKTINMPNSVAHIALDPFSFCASLEAIYVESDSDYFYSDEGVLYNKQLTEIVCCPPSYSSSSVSLPESVTKIGGYAFKNCTNLRSIVIPEGVTYIGEYAFQYTDIRQIDLPETVTDIAEDAFGHTKITSLEIPSSVERLGLTITEFSDSLTEITFLGENTPIEYPLLFWSDAIEVIKLPQGRELKQVELFSLPDYVSVEYFEN